MSPLNIHHYIAILTLLSTFFTTYDIAIVANPFFLTELSNYPMYFVQTLYWSNHGPYWKRNPYMKYFIVFQFVYYALLRCIVGLILVYDSLNTPYVYPAILMYAGGAYWSYKLYKKL